MIIGTIAKNPYKPVHGFACHALGFGVVLPKHLTTLNLTISKPNEYENDKILHPACVPVDGGRGDDASAD